MFDLFVQIFLGVVGSILGIFTGILLVFLACLVIYVLFFTD